MTQGVSITLLRKPQLGGKKVTCFFLEVQAIAESVESMGIWKKDVNEKWYGVESVIKKGRYQEIAQVTSCATSAVWKVMVIKIAHSQKGCIQRWLAGPRY